MPKQSDSSRSLTEYLYHTDVVSTIKLQRKRSFRRHFQMACASKRRDLRHWLADAVHPFGISHAVSGKARSRPMRLSSFKRTAMFIHSEYRMLYLERTDRSRCTEPFQPYGHTDTLSFWDQVRAVLLSHT